MRAISPTVCGLAGTRGTCLCGRDIYATVTVAGDARPPYNLSLHGRTSTAGWSGASTLLIIAYVGMIAELIGMKWCREFGLERYVLVMATLGHCTAWRSLVCQMDAS